MTHEEVFRRAELRGVNGAYSLIGEDHPVGLFLGLERGCRAVMVLCPRQPPETPPLAAIDVEVRPRHNGGWALVLRLDRPELKAVFSHLVADLEEATRSDPSDPGGVVVRRLARWQRLLSRRASMLLEEHELRGLAGELAFLSREAVPVLGPLRAVTGWKGPFGSPKDFIFDAVEIEVKAVRRLQRAVTVSSLEQLTDAGRPLFLWVCEVEPADEQDEHAVPFPDVVTATRAQLAAVPAAAEMFDSSLVEAGYIERPEYAKVFLRFEQSITYRVGGAFPRLTRDGVSAGIVSCRYEVMTAALEPYRAETWREG
jgi:hypothetical protein